MLISLDFSSDTPIYRQISDQIILFISKGYLKNGDRLPTVRNLSLELGVNTMTVSKAYQHLKISGYIETDRRKGALVKYASAENSGPTADDINDLRLSVSKIKLKGGSREDIIRIVNEIYERSTK